MSSLDAGFPQRICLGEGCDAGSGTPPTKSAARVQREHGLHFRPGTWFTFLPPADSPETSSRRHWDDRAPRRILRLCAEGPRTTTAFLKTINYGTQFSSDGRLATNVLTTPSRFQRHLQIADLVVGITCAMVGENTNYSTAMFPIIQEMLCESSSEKRGGVGLKVFPDDWRSLSASLLDESS